MTLRVNGRDVPAAGTLLDACRLAGAEVPAFCHDGRTTPGGHCRSCLVEADGRWVAACTTSSRDGVDVRTDTDALVAYRRDLGELMRAEAAPFGVVGETLARWGVTGDRYPRHARPQNEMSHPILGFEPDACILCRRCVDVCAEIQGQFVFGVEGRGVDTRIGWGGRTFADTDCVACGACVQTCPAGALTDRDHALPKGETDLVRTTCGYCGVGCQLDVHVGADRIAWIDGTEEAAVNRGHLCVKGRYSHRHTRHPDRLTAPLVRRDGHLVEATWDEAIAAAAEGLSRNRGRVAFLSSSRCTNEENYLVQKWARAGFQTNDVDCCARVCHGPSAVGMRAVLGTGAATNSIAEIDIADCILVVGANATEAHPVTGARIRRAALAGARLVVIDPRRTELAELADVHLQVRPGANVPLFKSLCAVLVHEGRVDLSFVGMHVDGYDAFVASLVGCLPETTEAVTGVPAALVYEAAHLYGDAIRPKMVHGLGVTEHLQGSEAVMLLCALALLRGAVGRPGVGVNPLRGQNNVQGAADMGCQPDLVTGYQPISDPGVRARFQAVWGRPVPSTPGRTIPQMLDAALTGGVRAMFVLGEDLAQTEPDTAHVERALDALDFLVVQELFLSKTAERADVVLPGASALEKDGTFTNGERRIQRVRPAVSPPGGARTDFDVLRALMAATGCDEPCATPAAAMDEIATVAPLFAGVRFDRLDGDGLQWPVPGADHPGTPILHTAGFPAGVASLRCVPFVPSPAFGRALTLVTGRVLEHYNAGTMTRRGASVTLCAADFLEIHPDDARGRGITDGDRVEIESAQGVAHAIARVTDRVLAGTLFLPFHFPETATNAVTSNVKDRLSGCPEYKLTEVAIRPVPRTPLEA